MSAAIKGLCAFSVFCGVCLSLMPEGAAKRLTKTGCAALLLTLLLRGLPALSEAPLSLFTAEAAQRRELFLTNAEDAYDALSKNAVAERYGAYVLSQAEALGVEGAKVSVTLRWSTEGLWYPERLRLRGKADETQRKRLAALLSAELGLDEGAIDWEEDG